MIMQPTRFSSKSGRDSFSKGLVGGMHCSLSVSKVQGSNAVPCHWVDFEVKRPPQHSIQHLKIGPDNVDLIHPGIDRDSVGKTTDMSILA